MAKERPADETRVTIYHPEVKSDPRELVSDDTTEFAMRIACEDPTEVDHLAKSVSRARARLKSVARELVSAMIALVLAYLGELLMYRVRKKVIRLRGAVGRVESGVLALERLLEAFWVRRLVGRQNLLRMLGARVREDDEDNPVCSLKLAERRYRANEGLCGLGQASAADSPTTRVIIGIRIVAGEPTWGLERFVSTGAGGWRLLHSSYEADAESLLLTFYSEPAAQEQLAGGAEPPKRAAEAAEGAPRDGGPEQTGPGQILDQAA